MAPDDGVQFPTQPGTGRRSTLSAGASALAAAAKAIDTAVADSISKDVAAFRQSYAKHAVAYSAACAKDAQSALVAADAGLAYVYDNFEFVRGGSTLTLSDAMASPQSKLHTGKVQGTGAPITELSVVYGGQSLSGEALASQARGWERYGCLEPGAARAIERAAIAKEWLDLRGRCFVLLGGSSALCPLRFLLQCGATVLAVGRRKPAVWAKLIALAKGSAGTLLFPCEAPPPAADDTDALAAAAGADLLTQTPEIGAWLAEQALAIGLPTTIGMYTYLDGEAHVRVSIACDMATTALIEAGKSGRLTLSLAYLQTPSLAYVIGDDIHAAAATRHDGSWLRTLWYPPNATPAVPTASGESRRYVHDGVLTMQGPNYLLAKTIQQWRALRARFCDGMVVSANVAPPARTASVLEGNKNASAIAKAYAGMGHTPPMITFDADTVTGMMAALLLHDLMNPTSIAQPTTKLDHPAELFTLQAFHGGSFRLGAKPTSLGRLWFLMGALSSADPRPAPEPPPPPPA